MVILAFKPQNKPEIKSVNKAVTTVSAGSRDTFCFEQISVDGQLVANELAPTAPSSVSRTVQQSRRSRLSLR